MSHNSQPEKLRIALLGTRGIPASYGGFETFAEELSVRLAARGHDLLVYGRRRFGSEVLGEGMHRGVRVRKTPTLMHKYLETPVHALTSFFDVLRQRVDLVLLCNAANSPFAWIARLFGIPVVINVDGIERMRGKWNALGRGWYRLGERCSTLFASRIVADAQVIAEYYQQRFGITAEVIGYGASVERREPGQLLRELKLEPGRYLLYVSRLEPENNALGVIEAYRELETDLPLVIVGDAPYADDYKAELRAAADPRVRFAGFRFGAAYQELRSHCRLYIQATEVGGTHPALVEAMAYGNVIVANDVPEHREVLGEAGLYYRKNDFADLRLRLSEALADPELSQRLGRAAAARATECYSWESVCDAYEELFAQLSGRVPAGVSAAVR